MDLGLHGQQVTTQSFDYTVSFQTSGGYELRIENDYTLHTPHGSWNFSPEPSNEDSQELAALADQRIDHAAVSSDGTLTVKFATGSELRVQASPSYEAWTVAGPRGMKVVCMPGGELATWKATDA
ncbi:hypothetical protein GCM10011581_48520 [Saccharopolyspora subtropica]|uniref:Uncharacterized protein n=1 Tax=Saccharopolyspora thermophila TaxID=89367 RepID=A0A917KC90_9PSEU|nr:DUF6188 family protein [Saccharopolyspora subtropica]GGJ05738.1 hypothetical protein GCM10011581_48520 [Saccharopolyspora subtropica]